MNAFYSKKIQKIKNFKLKIFLREKYFNPLFEFGANFFTDNNSRKNFLTYHQRPIYANDFGLWSDPLKSQPKTAVVIQGPLVKKNDFTLETIKIYKKLFPKAIIILSVWENESSIELEKIRKEHIEIVLNILPTSPLNGPGNMNLQMISSLAAIQKAKEFGAEYVLKTRTDQRIYAPNSLEFLRNIVEIFPAPQNTIQKKRIVGVSLNSFKYRPYGLSDMTMYGNIDDMLLYWGAKLDTRVLDTRALNESINIFTQAIIAEAYLVTEFVKKLGYKPKLNIEDSWYVLANYFCVIDQNSLDLYWPKYTRYTEHKTLEYTTLQSNQSLTFPEWLNLYANLKNKSKIPEEVMQTQFGSPIENPEK